MQRRKNGQYKKNNTGARILFLVLIFLLVLGVRVVASKTEPVIMPTIEKVDIDGLVQEATGKALQAKIETLENQVLATLATCETGSLDEPDGAIILDRAASNDTRRMSIGRYMFQRRTVIEYVKKFEGREIGKAEAIAISIDPERSTELARKVLFETKNGSKNWYTCSKKHGLAGKIDLINQLR